MRSKSKPWRAPIDCGDGSFAVPLTRGKVAYIDAADAGAVGAYEWHAVKKANRDAYYAKTEIDGRMVPLHQFILKVPTGSIVDHIDGDTLNDRRGNLRPATNRQNCINRPANKRNTSGFKGVVRVRRRWRAQLQVSGVCSHIGMFDTPEEAARAYDAKARELFGEFAWCNFPE